MLISTISAPASATTFAPNAIASGLEPKICIDTGCSTASIRNNSCVRSFLYLIPIALTISVQTKAAPCSLANSRYAISLTPAIGAKIALPWIGTLPMVHVSIIIIHLIKQVQPKPYLLLYIHTIITTNSIIVPLFISFVNKAETFQCKHWFYMVNTIGSTADELCQATCCHHSYIATHFSFHTCH